MTLIKMLSFVPVLTDVYVLKNSENLDKNNSKNPANNARKKYSKMNQMMSESTKEMKKSI